MQTKTTACKTKTDFFGSQTSLVLRPTVSDSDHSLVCIEGRHQPESSEGNRVEGAQEARPKPSGVGTNFGVGRQERRDTKDRSSRAGCGVIGEGTTSPFYQLRGLGSNGCSPAGSGAEPRPPKGFLALCAARLPLLVPQNVLHAVSSGTVQIHGLSRLTVIWGMCPLVLTPMPKPEGKFFTASIECCCITCRLLACWKARVFFCL